MSTLTPPSFASASGAAGAAYSTSTTVSKQRRPSDPPAPSYREASMLASDAMSSPPPIMPRSKMVAKPVLQQTQTQPHHQETSGVHTVPVPVVREEETPTVTQEMTSTDDSSQNPIDHINNNIIIIDNMQSNNTIDIDTLTSGTCGPERHAQDKLYDQQLQDIQEQQKQASNLNGPSVIFDGDHLKEEKVQEIEAKDDLDEEEGEDHDKFEMGGPEMGVPNAEGSRQKSFRSFFVHLNNTSSRVSQLISRLSGWSDNTPPEYDHDHDHGQRDIGADDLVLPANRSSQKALQARQTCMCIFCILIIAAIIVPVAVCSLAEMCSSNDNDNSDNSSQDDNIPTMAPTTIVPPDLTMPPISVMPNNNRTTTNNNVEFVTVNLGQTGAMIDIPEYTVPQLDDPFSPQYKAYAWFIYTYPAEILQDMPMWRIQQIFALATLFFSLRGGRWHPTNRQQWLNSSMSECQWSSDLVCYGPDDNTQQELEGVVQTISFNDFVFPLNNGTLPMELELLSELRMLQVNGAGLTTEMEAFFPAARLTGLSLFQTLSVGDNQIRGTLPSELGLLSALQSISAQNNALTGAIPSELGLLAGLEQLWLDGNNLSGQVPMPLCQMTIQRGGVDLDVDCATVVCPENCNCDCT
ncbi:Leucine Rich Repeat [Seminavis robusta]|uniref:Leucine Rich Repeat n=1 Tax=Seminavis robusta TaxID=568900 RepID=A0A9N8DAJ9_9STRA|nr:Leucine Rich Repeat [Seminavis robusta]|eukprot:Sro34_g021880.1 Leucine Rich Repeat (635) ;mRNA; f:28653-30557